MAYSRQLQSCASNTSDIDNKHLCVKSAKSLTISLIHIELNHHCVFSTFHLIFPYKIIEPNNEKRKCQSNCASCSSYSRLR